MHPLDMQQYHIGQKHAQIDNGKGAPSVSDNINIGLRFAIHEDGSGRDPTSRCPCAIAGENRSSLLTTSGCLQSSHPCHPILVCAQLSTDKGIGKTTMSSSSINYFYQASS